MRGALVLTALLIALGGCVNTPYGETPAWADAEGFPSLREVPEGGTSANTSAAHWRSVEADLLQARATAQAGFRNGLTNTDLCFEYAELFAPSIGLGTCWVGYARECAREHPAIAEYLGVPEGRTITGILMAGYSKYKFHRLPERDPLDVVWFVERGDE